ncbi:MAG: HDIG domain-containing protein [Bacteroidales bacterium]|nr:HDIG domain-containing protein [Bacteroidales bacterium]
MDKKSEKFKLFANIGLIVLSVLLVTYFLPETELQIPECLRSYKVDTKWAYEDYKAPFDVDHYPDTAHAVKKAKDEFVPIYERYDEVSRLNRLSALDTIVKAHSEVPLPLRMAVVSKVKECLDRGIIDESTRKLKVISENDENKPTAQFYTTEQVMKKLAIICPANTPAAKMVSEIAAEELLAPNIGKNDARSAKRLKVAIESARLPDGIVPKGSLIIRKGDIVTPEVANTLGQCYSKTVEINEKESSHLWSWLGQCALVSLMMASFFTFMYLFRNRTFFNYRKMVFLIVLITVFIVMVEIISVRLWWQIYLVPFALVPIVITTFTDSRTAFFSHMVMVVICSIVAKDRAEFIIMQFLVGNIAIASMHEFSRRAHLIRCAFFVFLGYTMVYLSMTAINKNFSSFTEFLNFYTDAPYNNWHNFLKFALNAGTLAFSYVLIFLVEKLFGFTSTMTLVELSDTNHPLLREMSTRCSGTFQHSLQVANLACEAASDIGANVQLVRAGALFHDVGKSENPAFFTENQYGVNPHDALSPIQSAQIVINHVSDGVKRATKAKLPQAIIDFIEQHHGKGRTKYFYAMACKANPDAEVDPTPYTYTGKNPQSKETAIVMMADACEAATRSLKNPDEATITGMVDKIVASQLSDGLLDEAPINLREIALVKQAFVNRLRSMYHQRIEYPDDVAPRKADAADATADAVEAQS